jgi:NADPH2:quinone reductase
MALKATAVFDGVGGETLSRIFEAVPNNAVIYSYGFVGDAAPLTFHVSTLALKNITIKPFSNFKSETVTNPDNLKKALNELATLIHMPHFKTKISKRFKLEEINDALQFKSEGGGKVVLSMMA